MERSGNKGIVKGGTFHWQVIRCRRTSHISGLYRAVDTQSAAVSAWGLGECPWLETWHGVPSFREPWTQVREGATAGGKESGAQLQEPTPIGYLYKWAMGPPNWRLGWCHEDPTGMGVPTISHGLHRDWYMDCTYQRPRTGPPWKSEDLACDPLAALSSSCYVMAYLLSPIHSFIHSAVLSQCL